MLPSFNKLKTFDRKQSLSKKNKKKSFKNLPLEQDFLEFKTILDNEMPSKKGSQK